jgi:4-hydroxy-3-methylbut-2-enyl diphosphate reductase
MVFRRRSGWHRFVYGFLRFLLLSNLWVSMGAAGLCYAATRLQRVSDFVPFVLIAFVYVQSMHILNHLTGRQADRYNEPDRAQFYQNRKIPLTIVALASGATGLIIAFGQGVVPFLILLVISLLGLSYRFTLVPKALSGIVYRRIQDVPGSKTVLIAMAWGVVTAVIPPLSANGTYGTTDFLIFLWSAGLVFARTAFFDILDMQGDRLVGKETIPILLGEKRSLQLLKGILAGLIITMPLLTGFGLVSTLGVLMALCPAVMLGIIFAFQKGVILPGLRLEFLVESHVVLAGVLSLVWSVT